MKKNSKKLFPQIVLKTCKKSKKKTVKIYSLANSQSSQKVMKMDI